MNVLSMSDLQLMDCNDPLFWIIEHCVNSWHYLFRMELIIFYWLELVVLLMFL